jgi:hypothetical protein
MVKLMQPKLLPPTLTFVLSLGLFAASAAQAETSVAALADRPTATPKETLAERQQRIALEMEAENLLVRLHNKPLESELEPCINGGVSPSGRFASAEIEEAVERLASGDLTRHLDNSAYFRAFNDGRIALTD